jgi:hypothetical protein
MDGPSGQRWSSGTASVAQVCAGSTTVPAGAAGHGPHSSAPGLARSTGAAAGFAGAQAMVAASASPARGIQLRRVIMVRR